MKDGIMMSVIRGSLPAVLAVSALCASAQSSDDQFASSLAATNANPPMVSAPAGRPAAPTALDRKIGQMIMVGFHGLHPDDEWTVKSTGEKIHWIDELRRQIGSGLVGNVILYKYNFDSAAQVKDLNRFLSESTKQPSKSADTVAPELPLMIAIDQEGGRVQRLNSKNGFADYSSAKVVAQEKTPEQAAEYYKGMAAMVAGAGFNAVFGPVVDVDLGSPVIGGLERSYSADPEKVVTYAQAFIGAMHGAGIKTCLKHFPGHGGAKGDTHDDIVDTTKTWTKAETKPFYDLIQKGQADMVMTAHIVNTKEFGGDAPATLSPVVLNGWLRKEAGFEGVIVTDDMHMGAIQKKYGLEEAVVRAIEAGADMIIFSNNEAAAKGVKDFEPDPYLPLKVAEIIRRRVSPERIEQSYKHISTLKASLKN